MFRRDEDKYVLKSTTRNRRPISKQHLDKIEVKYVHVDMYMDSLEGVSIFINPIFKRYCRITASKFHELAQCKTRDGTLVEQLFGAKLRETSAIQRGRELESLVLRAVEDNRKTKFHRSGIVLNPSFPVFGASPDAINDTFVVEIKCPFTAKTESTYITSKGKIAPRYLAQVQLQMHLCDKKFGLFCVASYDFEKTRSVNI